jgi:hypothetical protein
MPHLDPTFARSARWVGLSAGARAALEGMLQFAMLSSVEWTVEGSAAQIATWVGEESGLGRKSVQEGLSELEAAGLLKRGRTRVSGAAFVITAPLTGN